MAEPNSPETIMPSAPAEAAREIEGPVAHLRAEIAGAPDAARQARLLGEVGELEERAGDETNAAKDYLAAYNADPTFREPLEGLFRLLERRRSLKNLGKILDAMIRVAQSPEEKARALLAKAAFVDEATQDTANAKALVLEATDLPPPEPEAAQAWLMLEMLAAKLEDGALREQALFERAKHSGDLTWQALLQIDLARLRAANGDVDGALEAFGASRAAETAASYPSLLATERLLRTEPGLSGSDEAAARRIAYAQVLEAQAELLEIASRAPDRGDSLGVPRWVRTTTQLLVALLRAAEARRACGQDPRAAELLDRAMQRLDDCRPDERARLEPGLVNARVRLAELLGDTALAARLAAQRLEHEKDGGVAAALSMRIAEQAATEGDADAALEALQSAIRHDPACIPARALQLDLLADGGDPSAFAGQLEAFAEHLTSEEARGKAYLLSAYVWGARAKDVAGAKAALRQAQAAQVSPLVLAQVARFIAACSQDPAWFEETSRRLLHAAAGSSEGDSKSAIDDDERSALAFQILRQKLVRGAHGEGMKEALEALGTTPGGAWIARALEAFLPESVGATDPSRRRAAIDELAQMADDPDVTRAMSIVSALRAHRSGDREGARERLRELAETYGGDELIACYLADLERLGGDGKRAADASAACAIQTPDASLAASLLLEAGFERWRHGDRHGALAAFEEAVTRAPEAARSVLGWAARGLTDGSAEARRTALQHAREAGADPAVLALERFALEMTGGNDDDTAAALSELAARSAVNSADFAIAAALGRLAWPAGSNEPDLFDDALARLEEAGADARTFVAAERVRVARETEPQTLATAAKRWLEAGGGVPAALEWLAATLPEPSAKPQLAAASALADALNSRISHELRAHTHLVRWVREGGDVPFARGQSPAVRLVNLELSPPGCDPRRRVAALIDLGSALGDDARYDALALSAWSMLASGDAQGALRTFMKVTSRREKDVASWEGLRSAAASLGEKETRALAAEKLGELCAEATRGAEHWEAAALDWLDLGNDERGEAALDRAFERDPKRAVAFDRLFRRVRERKDGPKLLDIIGRRLNVADDPKEMTKLFWEQARVLREKGDNDLALKALESVTRLEPDHVGALALTGEIAIRRGLFEEAATALARLSSLPGAPGKNRVTAGIAAVDLYENKLDRHDQALTVLVGLHQAKLTTLPVRERLARAAGRTGAWQEATAILEELMHERPEQSGRVEAARLAMAIHRDRLAEPNAARAAIVKLLEEIPGDAEAVDMLLGIDVDPATKRPLLERARTAIVADLDRKPTDLTLVRRVGRVSRALGDDGWSQAALSISVALGEQDPHVGNVLLQLSAKKPRLPQMAMNDAIVTAVLAPGDEGPVAQLFSMMAPTLAEALGPSLAAAGVTKKDKVDPRAGLALRNEIASWAGAFGFREFDLYIGGKDPLGVTGVPGEVPALVVGAQVNTPLSPPTRGRIARELFAMLRGSTITRWRDETTVAAIVVACSNLADVRTDAPHYAMLAEVEKLIGKAIARKTKKLIAEVCRKIAEGRVDARLWANRALASHNRVAAVASGDLAATIVDITGQPVERLPALIPGDSRVEELIRFVLSPTYLELRRALGLEGALHA